MTTGISLVRENAESMQPPRSLWVTFPLGRPLGKPGDPGFQHRVISAGLDLLARESGPVLEDYPIEVPAVDDETTPACPVSFATTRNETDSWVSRLVSELGSLQPWYDLGRRRRGGRTLVGISHRSPEDNMAMIGRQLDEDELPVSDLDWFKRAIEDLKVFYLEALTAQPGDYNPQQIREILWRESSFGAALQRFYEMFEQDRELSLFARIVAPREIIGGPTGIWRSPSRNGNQE